jgi:lysozyme family protein
MVPDPEVIKPFRRCQIVGRTRRRVTAPAGCSNQPQPKEFFMDRNFARALTLVLKHEGGWSDHPADPGGATMKGVTLANFRRYVKADATKDDLRGITDAQLATVYRRFYWDAVHGAELPDGVDHAVFDFAVNSGPGRAAIYLQGVVGAVQDGRIGPATLNAVSAMMRATIINDLCDRRMAFLRGLATWPTFGKGWTARVSAVRSAALKLAAPNAPEHAPPSPAPVGHPVDDKQPTAPTRPAPHPAGRGSGLASFLQLITRAIAAWFIRGHRPWHR